MIERGADLGEVQRVLGHSNIATTGRYLTPSEDDPREAIGRAGVSDVVQALSSGFLQTEKRDQKMTGVSDLADVCNTRQAGDRAGEFEHTIFEKL